MNLDKIFHKYTLTGRFLETLYKTASSLHGMGSTRCVLEQLWSMEYLPEMIIK